MPHQIHVKRKGHGYYAVKTPIDAETHIGTGKNILEWVKHPDSEDFEFDQVTPLLGLPDPPFHVTDKQKGIVTVAYDGWDRGDTYWVYLIKVTEFGASGSMGQRILSDGSATIRNK